MTTFNQNKDVYDAIRMPAVLADKVARKSSPTGVSSNNWTGKHYQQNTAARQWNRFSGRLRFENETTENQVKTNNINPWTGVVSNKRLAFVCTLGCQSTKPRIINGLYNVNNHSNHHIISRAYCRNTKSNKSFRTKSMEAESSSQEKDSVTRTSRPTRQFLHTIATIVSGKQITLVSGDQPLLKQHNKS